MQEEVTSDHNEVWEQEVLNEIPEPVLEWADDFDYGDEVHNVAQEDLGLMNAYLRQNALKTDPNHSSRS